VCACVCVCGRLTEEASSETLVGEAVTGDEDVVSTVASEFNLDAVQLIPDTFYYDYKSVLHPEDEEKTTTELLVLQYPFQYRAAETLRC